MPKVILNDPDENRRAILFGTKKRPVQMSMMSRDTKIPRATLQRYRSVPSSIPLHNLAKIIRWNGLDEKQIGELFK